MQEILITIIFTINPSKHCVIYLIFIFYFKFKINSLAKTTKINCIFLGIYLWFLASENTVFCVLNSKLLRHFPLPHTPLEEVQSGWRDFLSTSLLTYVNKRIIPADLWLGFNGVTNIIIDFVKKRQPNLIATSKKTENNLMLKRYTYLL